MADEALAALTELVRLKRVKDRLKTLRESAGGVITREIGLLEEDYVANQPKAWARAFEVTSR